MKQALSTSKRYLSIRTWIYHKFHSWSNESIRLLWLPGNGCNNLLPA